MFKNTNCFQTDYIACASAEWPTCGFLLREWSRIWPLYRDTELNLGDRVLGEVEKNSLIALPGKGGHSGLMPSKWESASSTFRFQPGWGLHACGQQTVNSSRLAGGFSSCKTAWRYCSVYPLRGDPDPPQGSAIVSWLLLPDRYIPSLPWLATVWTCPLELREGLGGWMKPISCNQEMGEAEELLCPGAPLGPCSVSWAPIMSCSNASSWPWYVTFIFKGNERYSF